MGILQAAPLEQRASHPGHWERRALQGNGSCPRLPVSVPLAQVFLLRYRVDVRQRDDVAAVRTQPLLVQAALPLLQLVFLVLVGDANVGVVRVHAHACHGGVVALQEVQVNLFIALQIPFLRLTKCF